MIGIYSGYKDVKNLRYVSSFFVSCYRSDVCYQKVVQKVACILFEPTICFQVSWKERKKPDQKESLAHTKR